MKLTRWALAAMMLLCWTGTARATSAPVGDLYYTYYTTPDPSHGVGATIADDIGSTEMDGSNVNPTAIPGVQPGSIAVAGPYVYWVNIYDLKDNPPNEGGIGRANVNGTGANASFIALPAGISAGHIATEGPYIYFTWSNATDTASGIGRATLDGSTVDQDFITFSSSSGAFANGAGLLAADSSYLVFASDSDTGVTTFGRANLDGTGINDDLLQSSSIASFDGLAADNSYIYWTDGCYPSGCGDQDTSSIGRATINGSGFNDDFLNVTGTGRSIVVYDGYLFWDDYADNSESTIGTAQANGSGSVDNDLVTGLYSPLTLAAPTSTLTVNSTSLDRDEAQASEGNCNADPETTPTLCTLPQAILVSNATGGQPVSFDIPTGSGNTFDGAVPQIQDPTGSGTPAITAPATVDGTTQAGGQVELSGAANSSAFTYGLQVSTTGAGTTIKGMVVNGYKDEIALAGGNDTIQGDWLDSNPAGTTAVTNPLGASQGPGHAGQADIALESSGSQIGGSGTGQGNVLGTGWLVSGTMVTSAAGIVDQAGNSGNVIQGNRIGVQSNGDLLVDPVKPASSAVPEGAAILNGSEQLGGGYPGQGNTLAPSVGIAGPSVVQGNTFLGPVEVTGRATIGGPTVEPGTGDGNVFEPPLQPDLGTSQDLYVDGPSAVVQGNKLSGNAFGGIVIAADHTTIGGSSDALGNVISEDGTEPVPSGVVANRAGVEITGSDNSVEHNVLRDNGDDGAVAVYSGDGNTILGNSMSGNVIGIAFGHQYILDTDVSSSHGGPNDGEYYPILWSSKAGASATTISGRIQQPGSFTVDLYGVNTCASAPQGLDYIGSDHTSSITGGDDFRLGYGPLPAGDSAIVATVTSSGGSTSEFSSCLDKDGQASSFTGSGVASTSPSIPVSSSGGTAADIASEHKARKVGHGTVTLICPPRTTGNCTGTITIKTTGRHPVTVLKHRFKIFPGFRDPIRLTVPAAVFAKLAHSHRLRVAATTVAHDGAKHQHHKTKHFKLTLIYEAARG